MIRTGAARGVLVAMGLLAALLVGRIIQLQAAHTGQVYDLIDSQQSRQSLEARRGSLLDRRGRVLAATYSGERLFVDPLLVHDPNTFPERAAEAMGVDPVRVMVELAGQWDKRYVVLEKSATPEQVHGVTQAKLPGLARERYLRRAYPMGELAGQLLGGVGADGRGLEGLELTMDTPLSGERGRMVYLRDVRRRPLAFAADGLTSPADGRDALLSLDATIQAITEEELAAAVEKYAAKAGQAVMLDPLTGEILAMANVPRFDPASLATSHPDARRNRCVTDVFEPGSTFKPFAWSYAIDRAIARGDELIDTHDGYWKQARLRDTHAHDQLTYDDVLVQSSNIGIGVVASRMTNAQMFDAVSRFGFGQTTLSGLPGEVPGILRKPRDWSKLSITRIPMGQEVGVTTLQLARAFAVFANGGLLVAPTIHKRMPDEPFIVERVIGERTAEHARWVLRRVVTDGTGRKANSDRYPVFGKTGTAQVADLVNGGYREKAYTGAFLCGAPYHNPRLVLAVVIHEPDASKGYYGGTVAAPAAKRMLERTLEYLGEPALPTEEDVEQWVMVESD